MRLATLSKVFYIVVFLGVSNSLAATTYPNAVQNLEAVETNKTNRDAGSDREIAAVVAIDYLLGYSSLANSDEDELPDEQDNCTLVSNPSQLDSDSDGIGNSCDPDFNNDCVVNFSDFSALTDNFQEVGNTQWDLNGDGVVNFIDISRFRDYFLMVPGPSGVSNLCGSL